MAYPIINFVGVLALLIDALLEVAHLVIDILHPAPCRSTRRVEVTLVADPALGGMAVIHPVRHRSGRGTATHQRLIVLDGVVEIAVRSVIIGQGQLVVTRAA